MSASDLTKNQIKTMLQEIEEMGGRRYHSFVDICDANTPVFGEPSIDLRRAFQRQKENFMRKTNEKYLVLLEKYKITPSQYSRDDAESDPKGKPDPDKKPAVGPNPTVSFPPTVAKKNNDDVQDDIDDEYAMDDDDMDDGFLSDDHDPFASAGGLAKAFGALDINPLPASRPHRAGALKPSRTPPRTPPHTPPRAHSRTPPRQHRLASAPSSASHTIRVLIDRAILGVNATIGSETMVSTDRSDHVKTSVGSKLAPQRIDVDTNYPERHHPFFIVHVPHVIHGTVTAQVYEISTCIAIQDCNQFEAFIPKGQPNNRVLVRIPALQEWHSDSNRFHANRDCENTRIAHANAEVAIKNDPDRKFLHFMLNFPDDIDNMMLSSSRVKVASQMNLMREVNYKGTKKDLLGAATIWRVAIKDENDRSIQVQSEHDIESLLKNR